ncbi:bifunctional metallophosphatase/5'-nucleotidase [Bacillus horti]|uniref:2',3'-cyclic-nucleotide 2'-phosphodiesterase (5'-nucleotidase family) n=1 Tax=Caldalkalibacillus horti TaxID=77523 RepID=A0ABT9VTW6_9BACI|nr:bifunctional UDP-sugar hydrolase/5'-nucleotidase [Bacillus horti]MDQ0164426.1 2',3'-cyclic-nucleotide 2'-phosphodiesterase (5'-nucleotidase family) [Bacillus horti]
MKTNKLHIIHTNDFHSHFPNWPKVVRTIKQLKKSFEEQQEPYLLVDIGDHADRSHFLTDGTLGQVNIALLNQLGYNYVTIGNNEGLTFSKDQLSELYNDRRFQVILGNLFDMEGVQPAWLDPYAIHEVAGWKLGIMGVTANFNLFYELLGWRITNPIEILKEQIKALRGQVDVLILLSHLGLPKDEQIAEQLEGIDLIIGAHTHHVLADGKKIKDCHISQAGKFGKYVGHIQIELRAQSEEVNQSKTQLLPKYKTNDTNVLKAADKGYNIASSCIETEHSLEDIATTELLHKWENIAKDKLSRVVTVLEQDLQVEWHSESELGNLLAESLRRWCGTEIALVNTGQILGNLKQGVVTIEQLLHICPHPINPCILQMSGKQLWSILQHSLNPEIERLHIMGFGFRGKIMGTLAVDGLQIHYRERGKQKEIMDIWANGVPLQKEESYNIASIDMFTFGHIFPEFQEAEKITYLLPEFIRDLLAFRLAEQGLSSSYQKRWLNKDLS